MKATTLFLLIISFQLYPQIANYPELHKILNMGGKYSEMSKSVYKIDYPGGVSEILNFNASSVKPRQDLNIISFKIEDIDTNLYASKFKFWQRLPVSSSQFYPPIISDLNNNESPEIYGFDDFVLDEGSYHVVVYEMNKNKLYKRIYSYPDSTVFVKAIGKIHNDSTVDLYIHHRSTNNGVFYRNIKTDTLPNVYDFTLNLGYTPNQINDMTIGDFDNDGNADLAFIDGNTPCKVYIGKYVDSLNNIALLFDKTEAINDPAGFCIADFDNDGKKEIVYATTSGDVNVIKNTAREQYSLSWTGNCGILNAYMHAVTNDIDGNGKKEFWIGGQDFTRGITQLCCYESDGSGGYNQVASIQFDLNSLFMWYLQAADMDGDGKEELVLNIGNCLIILKFTGSVNNPDYSIFYAKINELTEPTADFKVVGLADLNGDGKTDIFLPMDKYVPIDHTYVFSYILTNQIPTTVNDNLSIIKDYNLSQNYPNPFNPSTSISYSLPTRQTITLKVYDILGKEITTLVNEEKPAGRYTANFNALNLSSGIYFYTLRAGGFSQTQKMIFLK